MGSRLEAKSSAVRKRIESHTFENEEGEEYGGSSFGGFPEYFRRKKIKLQNLDAELRAQSVDAPKILRGIVCHINGYTRPSLNDLHKLIVTHGGGFIQYLDGKTQVTHIIASSLTPKKAVEFKRYRIVKPAWIVDSVNAGKLLPWSDYAVVTEGENQKVLQFAAGTLSAEANTQRKGYRDQTDTSWYTTQLYGTGNLESAEKSVEDLPLEHDDEFGTPVELPEVVDTEAEVDIEKDKSPVLVSDAYDGMAVDVDDHYIESAQIPREPKAEELTRDEQQSHELQGELPDLRPDRWPSPTSAKRQGESLEEFNTRRANMTAEEHNTELLSDPRIRKSSVLNPDFLEQYYRESRLHHLSTWKADLKCQLQVLTAQQTSSQKERHRRKPGARRYILHVDFDSFFVAISTKKYPEYVDKPAVVAHGGGAGAEIASCNYPARKFGVKNGMWMKKAQDLCKDLKVLPYDFPGYEAASRIFYEIIMESGGLVQSVSIDEALVDVTNSVLAAGGTDGIVIREGSADREQAKANEIAQSIRDKVMDRVGCAVSVGIGGNILLAKLALRKGKPAGQYQIRPEEVLPFLDELQVQDLPGVAYSIGGKLSDMGVAYVKDIRDISKERLLNILGPKTGEKLWGYARGIDKQEVGDVTIRKSVSAEVNWGVRFETQEQVDEFIESLSGELSKRLLKETTRGRHLTMKIMRRARDAPLDPPKHLGHGKCDTFNKSITLGVATNDKAMITKEALSLLHGFGFSPGELRGLGLQMTRLDNAKPSTTNTLDSGQKRLQFKSEPISLNVDSADKKSAEATNLGLPSSQSGGHRRFQFKSPSHSQPHAETELNPLDNDPIQDDPETPRKPDKQLHSVPCLPLPLQNHDDSPTKKPLNTHGTQFLLPTQVDPGVLEQLPADIKSRLRRRQESTLKANHNGGSAADRASIAQPELDIEALNALPEALRAEVLAEYASPTGRPPSRAGQSVLPQSPRKQRTVNVKRGTRGRPRGSSLLSRLKGASGRGATNTLTQANFVKLATDKSINHDTATESDGDDSEVTMADIEPEFLAALPEDIRQEVMNNHKRERLRKTGGIEIQQRRGRALQRSHEAGQLDTTTYAVPARPPRPTFTVSRLHKQGDLREAISAWYQEFRNEGPYDEDTQALIRYLNSVVLEEQDMNKAVAVTKWFGWVLTTADDFTKARKKWEAALLKVQHAVQEAVCARGLGEIDL